MKKILLTTFSLFSFLIYCQAQCPAGADKDRDGVPNVVDLDIDNDGILNTDEDNHPYFLANGVNLNVNANQTSSAGSWDLSYFWGLPSGSVVLQSANYHTNNSASLGVSNSSNTTWFVNGSVPVKVMVTHGGGLQLPSQDQNSTGTRDGITSLDGQDWINDTSPEAGFVYDSLAPAHNDYYVETTSGDGNGGTFTWTSVGYTSMFRVWTTNNESFDNNYNIRLRPTMDTDGDGIPDFADLDSDNDGIPDAIEACSDITLMLDSCSLDLSAAESYPDGDNDGCPDGIIAGAQCTPVDTDNDGTPDFRDPDSDNDGCPDSAEAGTDGISNVDTWGNRLVVTHWGVLKWNEAIGLCGVPINNFWIDATTKVSCIDCNTAISNNLDICAEINNDPNHPWAQIDCDNGGIINIDECLAGFDPTDDSDECGAALASGFDLCVPSIDTSISEINDIDAYIGINDSQNFLDNPLYTFPDPATPTYATLSNIEFTIFATVQGNSCENEIELQITDPSGVVVYQGAPFSTCNGTGQLYTTTISISNANTSGQMDNWYVRFRDINDQNQGAVEFIARHGSFTYDVVAVHPLSEKDCDEGGVYNEFECENGGDPTDPADDCLVAVNGDLDLCVLINYDPDHPLATLDCDNGGVTNIEECINGQDPTQPSDDCVTAIEGDLDICLILDDGNGGYDSDHPLATLDCDHGGIINIVECITGEDPSDPIDDCIAAIEGNMNICVIISDGNGGYDPNHPLASLDCDNGGVINITECINGEEPDDPADDCQAGLDAGIDLCTLINGDPNHPLATLDCDNGGIPNIDECNTGDDPSDPVDDCQAAIDGGIDICAILTADPNNPLGTQDCDNGGIDNQTECDNNTDPNDPSDDCDAAIQGNVDICAEINGNPNHPLASQDCDNGGVINIIECNNGGDANDPADDCTIAENAGVNICALINYDPNHPLATLDCDNGGIPNIIECNNGQDPFDPSDDCEAAVDAGFDICTYLGNNPGNPLATTDCDGDGVVNGRECDDNTDPLDPCDYENGSITLPVTADQSGCPVFCPDLSPILTILPGNIAGISTVEAAVEVFELNNFDTDGSTILLRIPSDPRIQFVWDIGLTMAALVPVQNADWNYLGDNGVVHQWTYNGPNVTILGGGDSALGFQSIYDPQATDGQTTITATIVPFGGGECNILNNTDSERLVYFE